MNQLTYGIQMIPLDMVTIAIIMMLVACGIVLIFVESMDFGEWLYKITHKNKR